MAGMSGSAVSGTFVAVLTARAAGPEARALDRGIRIAAVLMATVLTAAAAQVAIPLPATPVPFTLQPMAVLLVAMALGARLAMVSQLLYLGAGLAGLPVFAASVTLLPGAARLLGPTGGYLLSYPIAAWVVGALAERGFDRRYVTAGAAMAVGLAVIYAGGVSWLAWFAFPLPGADGDTVRRGLMAALTSGVVPFVLMDALKVLGAALVLPACWRLTGRLTGSSQ